jgi:hypothetical protein
MDLIGLLIDVVILCLVGGLIYYIITIIPLPDPFKTIAIVAVLVIFLLILISVLLGGGTFMPHYRIR